MSFFLLFTLNSPIKAQDDNSESIENIEDVTQEELNTQFTVINEDGSISIHESKFETYEPDYYEVVQTLDNQKEVIGTYESKLEAEEVIQTKEMSRSVGEFSVQDAFDARQGVYNVARLKGTFYFVNSITNAKDIFAGGSASDAAYLSTNGDGTVKVKVASTIVNVPAANVTLVDYSSGVPTSHYIVENGRLKHVYYYNNMGASSSNWVGYQPPYLKANTKYFSYDGNYFYTDYKQMIDDYRNATYSHAINSNSPFYNYYEYLSHRTVSNFTASDLNNYFLSIKGNITSKMKDQGQAFVNAQNQYGVNASLMYGTAVNESGWGTSTFSLERNNLFGHKASDTNPNDAARYSSVEECIKKHAYEYISVGYLDPNDYRYRGPHLGNKYSGVSSKYASDPYTGEKKAYFSYEINEFTKKNDYNKYTIGITSGRNAVYNSTKDKKVLYYTGTGSYGNGLSNFPLVILGTETGTDGLQYYKIQSDAPLNDVRSKIDPYREYSFSRDYAYIPVSQVVIPNIGGNVLVRSGYTVSGSNVSGFVEGSDVSLIINKIRSIDATSFVSIKNANGKSITSGRVSSGMIITLNENGQEKTYNIIIRGDVNGDGKISSLDYATIKNHILKIKTITGVYSNASDVNLDGKISSLDYALIKNHILKISNIQQ